MESKVIEVLCDKFKASKKCAEEAVTLTKEVE